MQGSNHSWLEVETRYRIADLNAAARASRRVRRRPAARFPAPPTARRVVGRGLVALGRRLAGPKSLGHRSAA